MRPLILVAIALLAGCASPPPTASQPKLRPDITKEAWYAQSVDQLAAIARNAERLLNDGKRAEAAALITDGQPLSARLLSATRPTLPAMEAASDLDQLYGRMLFENGRYGWARLQYQKNVARWKSWRPQTPDTGRRLKLARDAIAECDRRLQATTP